MNSHRLHIGINAHLLSMEESYRSAGLSNYIENLLLGLSEIDAKNQYRVFTGPWARQSRLRNRLALGRNFKINPSRFPTQKPLVRIGWEQLIQAPLMTKMDVVHSMANVIPLCRLGRAKHVVTIPDLVFLLFGDKHGATQRRYLEYMVKQSVRNADRVIAISHNTGRDIVRLLDVPQEKVVVVPLAAGTEFKPLAEPEIEHFRRLKGLPKQFFLYLGTLEPRKNIPALLQAYAHLRDLQENAPMLVVAGGKGWNYERIFQLVKELELEHHVLFPGFVPRDEVVFWFNAATVFVYLSEYEGFGLPPLQAMACGVPVIVNNASSLPEVVGEGGYVLDANAPEQVAKALQGLANDPTLRQEMADLALARSQEFSWNSAARETLAVYEEAQAR